MGEQILGMVWFSSGIKFGSCCDVDLWIGQVKCVPLSSILSNLEAENHHYQVLQLQYLELWHHRELVLVLWSMMLLHVLGIPIIILFISLVKFWILFISMVETLVIVAGG